MTTVPTGLVGQLCLAEHRACKAWTKETTMSVHRFPRRSSTELALLRLCLRASEPTADVRALLAALNNDDAGYERAIRDMEAETRLDQIAANDAGNGTGSDGPVT